MKSRLVFLPVPCWCPFDVCRTSVRSGQWNIAGRGLKNQGLWEIHSMTPQDGPCGQVTLAVNQLFLLQWQLSLLEVFLLTGTAKKLTHPWSGLRIVCRSPILCHTSRWYLRCQRNYMNVWVHLEYLTVVTGKGRNLLILMFSEKKKPVGLNGTGPWESVPLV